MQTLSVTLTWGASTDDAGVAGYVVTRNGVRIATPTATNWTDGGRLPKTMYTYAVSAVDTAARLSSAAQVVATTKPDTQSPTTPRYFHRVRQSGRYVTFGWARSTDNVRVARYLIFRVGRSRPIASTVRLWIRLYTVRGATYYVRAVDPSGNWSGLSTRVRIRY